MSRVVIRPVGQQGIPGEGVASGGTTGQILAKASNADYDTLWTDNDPDGVQSVTGDGVGGTAEDVVLTFPTPAEIGAYPDTNPDGFVDASGASAAAPIQSVNAQTGVVVLDAGDVGAIPTSEKGVANGVASLGANSIVPYAQTFVTPWPSKTSTMAQFYGTRFARAIQTVSLTASNTVWTNVVEVPVAMSITEIWINVVAGGGAGSAVELALYTYDADHTATITRLGTAGTVATETNGQKAGVFGTPINVPAGLVRLACIWTGGGAAPTVTMLNGNMFLGAAASSLASIRQEYFRGTIVGVSSPLPATLGNFASDGVMISLAYRGTPQ